MENEILLLLFAFGVMIALYRAVDERIQMLEDSADILLAKDHLSELDERILVEYIAIQMASH